MRGIEGRSICAFGKDPSRIVVVSADGTFIVSSFDEGGDCARISTAKFLRNREEMIPDEDAVSWNASGLVNTGSAPQQVGSLGGMAQI